MLSTEECDYLVWLCEAENVWVDDTLSFFKMLPIRKYSSQHTVQLILRTHAKTKEFMGKSFSKEMFCTKMDILKVNEKNKNILSTYCINQPDDSAHCAVFISAPDNHQIILENNKNKLYPNVGSVLADEITNAEQYGITYLSNQDIFVISSLWSFDNTQETYREDISKMHNYMQACQQPEQPVVR